MLQRSQHRAPSLKNFIEFFDEETVLVSDPIFSREAITAYVGTRSAIIKEKREAIARSMVQLQQILRNT